MYAIRSYYAEKGEAMAIWQKAYSLEELNGMARCNMVAHLGIEFTAIGDDS